MPRQQAEEIPFRGNLTRARRLLGPPRSELKSRAAAYDNPIMLQSKSG